MIVKITNRNGITSDQISPWLTIQHKNMELIMKIGSRFGLTPADRATLCIPEDTDDEFDDFINNK
jgi:phage terminase small subunit